MRSPPLQGNVPPNTYKPAENDHFSQLVFASCIRCPTHTSTDLKTQFLLFVRLEKREREIDEDGGRGNKKPKAEPSRFSSNPKCSLCLIIIFFFYPLERRGEKINQRLQKKNNKKRETEQECVLIKGSEVEVMEEEEMWGDKKKRGNHRSIPLPPSGMKIRYRQRRLSVLPPRASEAE